MKNLLQFTKTIIMILVALFGVSYVSAQTSWVGPTDVFPNGNVSAPLNAGPGDQIKQGILQLGDENNSGGLTVWSGATLLPGDLSVGTSTLAANTGLMALFDGKIGASEYCDEFGQNCRSSASSTGNVVFVTPSVVIPSVKFKFFTTASGYGSEVPQYMAYGENDSASDIPNPHGVKIPISEIKSYFGETKTIKGLILSLENFTYNQNGKTTAEATNGDYYTQLYNSSKRGYPSNYSNWPATIGNKLFHHSYVRDSNIANVEGIKNKLSSSHEFSIFIDNQNDAYIEMRLVTTSPQVYETYWSADIRVIGYVL